MAQERPICLRRSLPSAFAEQIVRKGVEKARWQYFPLPPRHLYEDFWPYLRSLPEIPPQVWQSRIKVITDWDGVWPNNPRLIEKGLRQLSDPARVDIVVFWTQRPIISEDFWQKVPKQLRRAISGPATTRFPLFTEEDVRFLERQSFLTAQGKPGNVAVLHKGEDIVPLLRDFRPLEADNQNPVSVIYIGSCPLDVPFAQELKRKLAKSLPGDTSWLFAHTHCTFL